MPRGPKGKKRPADVIGNAVHVMRIAAGEIEEATDAAQNGQGMHYRPPSIPRPYPGTSAMTVVAIRIAAKRRLTIRDAIGSRRRRDSAAPAKSQNRWMTTIMTVSTADFSSASRRRGATGSVVPANTAAIARYALGLAIARRNPPAKDGARASPSCRASGGAVAILNAR